MAPERAIFYIAGGDPAGFLLSRGLSALDGHGIKKIPKPSLTISIDYMLYARYAGPQHVGARVAPEKLDFLASLPPPNHQAATGGGSWTKTNI